MSFHRSRKWYLTHYITGCDTRKHISSCFVLHHCSVSHIKIGTLLWTLIIFQMSFWKKKKKKPSTTPKRKSKVSCYWWTQWLLCAFSIYTTFKKKKKCYYNNL